MPHSGLMRVMTATAGSGDDLTPREWEVAALVADGLSDDDIARRLYISTNTVKTHLSKILSKLGLERRPEVREWYGAQ